MDARIQELEIRLAFQEDLLQGLNAEVHSAHRLIAQLRAELQELRSELAGVRASRPADSSQEPPPPHY